MKRIFLSLLILMMLALAGCTLILPQGAAAELPPQIVAFSVNPASVETGKPAMLTWQVTGAVSVVIEPGLPSLPLAGSERVNPSQTTDYTIVASNKSGTARSTVKLSVTEPAAPVLSEPPLILSFKATPEEIWAGGTVMLSWEVLNAKSIRVESDRGDAYTARDAFGSMGFEPFHATEYKLIAKNDFGSSELKAPVTIRKDEAYYSEGGGEGGGGGGGG